MSKPKILVVLSSHPQGWYLPEFAHPYDVLSPYCDFVIASPKGGEAPIDQGSVELDKSDASSVEFYKNQKKLWQETERLDSFIGKTQDFAAIFYVGGHGPMFDLAEDATSIQLIREFYDTDRAISAVCHGVAALVNVKKADGSLLLAGEPVTGFCNIEEEAIDGVKDMPFLLEDALRKASGWNYESAEQPWGPKVVVARGGKLITGQNPASAYGLAGELLTVVTGSA